MLVLIWFLIILQHLQKEARMPELPEVQTVIETMRPKLLGYRLREIISHNNATVIYQDDFSPFVINNIVRRGKYIILLGEDSALTIHLRMTGRLLEQPVHERFVRAELVFDHLTLHFEDMRKFGRITFVRSTTVDQLPGVKNLGPEPWDGLLDQELSKQLKRSKSNLKTFLLKQENVAGIGNIYADEICFHAKLHPERNTNSLSNNEARRLLYSIRYILDKAITLRGTSFAHFIDANGKKGNNFEHLHVYGRKGETCHRCSTTLTTKKVHGRTTVYCKHCQI